MSVQRITTKAIDVKVGDRITEAPAGVAGWVTVEREVADAAPGWYRTPSGSLYLVNDDGSISNLVHTTARALPSVAEPVSIRSMPEGVARHREAVDIITRDVLTHYQRRRGRSLLAGSIGLLAINDVRDGHGLLDLGEGDGGR